MAARSGLELRAFPMFEARSVQWDVPELAAFDGLLVGSANVFRHGGDGLRELVRLPVHAVGEATAAAASSAGFVVETCGMGGLQSVVDGLAGKSPQHLLRLAGESHLSLDLPRGITIETRVVYRIAALPMPSSLRDGLRDGGVVMLHSADAAVHFAQECDRLGLDRGAITLAALGPRIADAAGSGWRKVESAGDPRDAALLELCVRMCETND
nr:uroporphyrinogen-III synthase [Parapontixanthobacter aurantiacus]